jgi:hypothetical protein
MGGTGCILNSPRLARLEEHEPSQWSAQAAADLTAELQVCPY